MAVNSFEPQAAINPVNERIKKRQECLFCVIDKKRNMKEKIAITIPKPYTTPPENQYKEENADGVIRKIEDAKQQPAIIDSNRGGFLSEFIPELNDRMNIKKRTLMPVIVIKWINIGNPITEIRMGKRFAIHVIGGVM